MLKAWKDEYLIGIEEIDEQHKKLFEIANRAYDLLKNDIYVDKYDRIVAIIDELKDYTVFHFNSEEKYMESIGYKRLFSQKIEHGKFIERLDKINLDDIDNNQDEYIMSILQFVVDWIENHILTTDKLIIKQ